MELLSDDVALKDDVSTIHFYDTVYMSCLHQNIAEMRKAQILCDATLVVGSKEILAHKVILAAASPYFQAIFSTDMVEAMEGKIILRDIEYSILEEVVDFLYSSQIEINDGNVYSVMHLADLLQVTPLHRVCSHYLSKSLSTGNCLSTYACALQRDYPELECDAFRFICRNFWKVLKEEEFLVAPLQTLLKILDSSMLVVGDEGEILVGVMRWVKHNQSSRLNQLDSLIAKVDLNSVPMEVLISVKSDLDLANTNLPSQVTLTLSAILEKRYENSTNWGCWRNSCWERRRFNQQREVVVIIGGETDTNLCRYMECTVVGSDKWKRLMPRVVDMDTAGENSVVMPLMNRARRNAAHAHTDYEVYVIGGEDAQGEPMSHVEMFNIKTHSWTELCPLPCAVTGPAAALVGSRLHVVGGCTEDDVQNTAWIYHKDRDGWRDLPPMNESRSHCGCASVNGFVYALGGMGVNAPLASVERYDPGMRRWYHVAPMREARTRMGCVAIEEFIYVMGGSNSMLWLESVERYNTLTNEWTWLHPMSMARCSFGTTVCGGRVYCLGGLMSTGPLTACEKYNPQSDRWQPVTFLGTPRSAIGAATLNLPSVNPAPI